ncbi:PLP-dependent aminotransferase family protein [Clostridium scatologenes]|uniref:Transcriptional regulator, GntR family with aminotransferase domain n=1 Tax=Clostridium scatologenes TaxID=1548 RepID=A0A0E3JM43_CLOSL|nr:PLP-dependent aminotransferase family protein [Clostridium scatologenes]AKA67635.1 transcriptional regulator, GntR family with aminotransferase domain [Clostridium scatologenes]
MFSFTPLLDNTINKPIYYQLYECIKKEIIYGNIRGDEKLPSLRNLSKNLQLSKNTIEAAYDQLYAEGYIKRIPKVGYVVENIDSDLLKLSHISNSLTFKNEEAENIKKLKYDLAPKYMDKKCYNIKTWKNIINSVINNEFESLLSYGDSQGEYELRFEIAKYIYENRGVQCKPNQIVVGAGTQYCLNLICQILRGNFDSIGMEEPGSNYIRYVFERNQFNIKPIDVNENGLDVRKLENSRCKITFVTPSHQFPKGVIMSVKNRLQLLNWAQNNDGIIIEDDYDSEMRFSNKPIPALKSLDNFDRVIYLGTFSKIFIPSIRISFMVLPNWLLDLYLDKYKMNGQTTSKLEQIALARFMNKGYLQSHIRKARRHYEKKYKVITKAIHTFMGDKVNLISSNTGMRAILEFETSCGEEEIVNIAKNVGIKITPISKYYIDKNNYDGNGKVRVLISYKGIPIEDIEPVIKLLNDIWFNDN